MHSNDDIPQLFSIFSLLLYDASASYRRVMLAVVAQLDCLRQGDVMLMLSHQLTVFGVGHPRLAVVKEDDARRAQDHQTGEEPQNGEADDLASADQRIGFGRTQQQLVEHTSRSGRFHSGLVLRLADVDLTGRAGQSSGTETETVRTTRVHAGSSVLTARAAEEIRSLNLASF